MFISGNINVLQTFLASNVNFLKKIYVFLAAPGLHCSTGTFYTCRSSVLRALGFLIGEHRLEGMSASAVSVPGSRAQ